MNGFPWVCLNWPTPGYVCWRLLNYRFLFIFKSNSRRTAFLFLSNWKMYCKIWLNTTRIRLHIGIFTTEIPSYIFVVGSRNQLLSKSAVFIVYESNWKYKCNTNTKMVTSSWDTRHIILHDTNGISQPISFEFVTKWI